MSRFSPKFLSPSPTGNRVVPIKSISPPAGLSRPGSAPMSFSPPGLSRRDSGDSVAPPPEVNLLKERVGNVICERAFEFFDRANDGSISEEELMLLVSRPVVRSNLYAGMYCRHCRAVVYAPIAVTNPPQAS